jgi:aspartyl-tRNA(Asn)/glutamyl-tRNA(Gln) amidotransferase subunit C
MEVNKDLVKYIAHLARIRLSEKDLERFVPQLKNILAYVEKLNKVDISGTAPTSHVLPLKNVYRDDKVKRSIDSKEALQNAPAKEGNFFKVPRVIEET